jgi:hypothetical protein
LFNLAKIRNNFNFFVIHYLILILYAALLKQCNETQDCSLIHGLLCACTSVQRSKTCLRVNAS